MKANVTVSRTLCVTCHNCHNDAVGHTTRDRSVAWHVMVSILEDEQKNDNFIIILRKISLY